MISLANVGNLAKLPATELLTVGREAVVNARSSDELRGIIATIKALNTYSKSVRAKDDAINATVEIRGFAEKVLDGHHELLKRKRQEQKAQQARWILNARKALNPGEQKPCCVCEKYQEICQAHHIMPLYLQYDLGIRDLSSVNHEFAWLCPTDHRVVHKWIEDCLKRKAFRMQGVGLYGDLEYFELQTLVDRCITIYNEIWNIIQSKRHAAV